MIALGTSATRWRSGFALLVACAALTCLAAPATAKSDGMRGPAIHGTPRLPLGTLAAPDYLANTRSAAASASAPAAAAPLLGLLEVYRAVISPVDGDRCSMAPTCSLYSVQAFKRYGIALGFVLTADRLLHEADEQSRAPYYEQQGRRYYLDPLAANTYWLPDWLR